MSFPERFFGKDLELPYQKVEEDNEPEKIPHLIIEDKQEQPTWVSLVDANELQVGEKVYSREEALKLRDFIAEHLGR